MEADDNDNTETDKKKTCSTSKNNEWSNQLTNAVTITVSIEITLFAFNFFENRPN